MIDNSVPDIDQQSQPPKDNSFNEKDKLYIHTHTLIYNYSLSFITIVNLPNANAKSQTHPTSSQTTIKVP